MRRRRTTTHGRTARQLADLADAKLLASYFRNAPEDAVQPIANALQRAAAEAGLTTGAEARLALVVDQMEELFTRERVDDAERAGFISVLSSLASRRVFLPS